MISRKCYDQLFLPLQVRIKDFTTEQGIKKYVPMDDYSRIVNTVVQLPRFSRFPKAIKKEICKGGIPEELKEITLRQSISNIIHLIETGVVIPLQDAKRIAEAIKKHPKLFKKLRNTLTSKQLKILQLWIDGIPYPQICKKNGLVLSQLKEVMKEIRGKIQQAIGIIEIGTC